MKSDIRKQGFIAAWRFISLKNYFFGIGASKIARNIIVNVNEKRLFSII